MTSKAHSWHSQGVDASLFRVITAQTLEQAERESHDHSQVEYRPKAKLEEELKDLVDRIKTDKEHKLTRKEIDLVRANTHEDMKAFLKGGQGLDQAVGFKLTALFDESPPHRSLEFVVVCFCCS